MSSHERVGSGLAPAGESALRLAEVVHDLRSPLQTIRVSVEHLGRRDDLPEDAAATLRRLASAAQRVVELSERLQVAAQSGAADEAVKLQRVELTTVCRRAVEQARALYPERRIALDAPRPVVGRWDPERLRGLVQNLVDNAARHGRGRVRVEVSSDGARASLRVRNDGAPLSRAARASLFSPLREEAGAEGGLGLHIVRRAVEDHGGRIECSSGEEETVFSVSLPRFADAARRPRRGE